MRKITKIIYFVNSRLNRRDYERFGIEIFIQEGFEVYVWDFTPFLYPEVHQKVKVQDAITYEKSRQIFTKKEALSAIKSTSDGSFVIARIGYNLKSYPIFRALSKKRIPYSVFTANVYPSMSPNSHPILVLNKILQLTPKALINCLFIRIPHRYLGIKPAHFNLAGGELSIINHRYPVGPKTETIWLHTLDYDIYLKERNKVIQSKKNMGIFLDQYLPFHPDVLYVGASFSTTPEEYYSSLCRFFDFLECNHSARIMIAAHPRSRYEELSDFFGGRPVIRGKTVQMIRESEFVIGHDSLSLNFAVLFNKPAIFITTDQLEQSRHNRSIRIMASWLGKQPINIDKPMGLNWDKELTVDKKAYSKYRNCHIKKDGSEELPFWQVVSNKIKGLEA